VGIAYKNLKNFQKQQVSNLHYHWQILTNCIFNKY
jgi:hypothetical protein